MNRKPVESVCWLSKLKKGELKRKENQKKGIVGQGKEERREGVKEENHLKRQIERRSD